jgi:hypothetical protein
VNLLKVEPGSVSETCSTSSRDGNQAIDIKVEEDPVPIEFPGIKAEHEVSCMYVCSLLYLFHRHPELCIVFLNLICLSVSPEDVTLMNIACEVPILLSALISFNLHEMKSEVRGLLWNVVVHSSVCVCMKEDRPTLSSSVLSLIHIPIIYTN